MRTSGFSFFVLCCIISIAVCTSAQASDAFDAEDLLRMKRVTSAELSPDEQWVACTVETMRPARSPAGSSYSELFLVSTDTKEVRPFVVGEERVTDIKWRPDGSGIAFLAKRYNEKETQVWMIPMAGGEARRLTSVSTGVLSFQWSPDGQRLAYVALQPKRPEQEALENKGYGFTFFEENLRSRNLYIMTVSPEEETEADQLTEGISVWSFVFAPDGNTIALAASERNLVDHQYMFQSIYLFDIRKKSQTTLVPQPHKIGNFKFSPDGSYLVFSAALEQKDHQVSQVYVVPTAGGERRNLTEPDFRGHVNWVSWLDAGTVLYRAAEGVHFSLNTVPVSGGERKVIWSSLDSGVQLDRINPGNKGESFFGIGESARHPGEVYRLKDGKLDRLTTVNPWLSDRQLGEQKVVTWNARDGLAIEGLLILPVGYKQGTRYPLVVVVHGGPESHYSNGWLTNHNAPAQVLAGKGYAVFYPNYRASTGYGTGFAAMGYGDPAGKEFDDIVDGIEFLIAEGIADKDRVGLGGGSYGGFASAWFATYYTKYVRAVCMSVGVSDLISMAATTDIPWEHIYVHWGKKLDAMWDLALKRSPIYYAHQSRTATLIMGGAADTRVSPTQSMELYRIMKLNGHPAVRLVQYPGEGHGNNKQPARIDQLYRTLDWYDWYVRDAKPFDGPMPPLDVSDKYGIQ